MATNAPANAQSLARSQLNKKTLQTLDAILYDTAPLIDALMKEGIPYTKMVLPGEQAIGGQ